VLDPSSACLTCQGLLRDAPVLPCVVVAATPLNDPRYRLTSERRDNVPPGWQETLHVQSHPG